MTQVYELIGTDGVVQFTGTINPAPGGGSQPGAVYKVDVLFTEPAGAHADLVAAVIIPVGASVVGVFQIPLAGPWTDPVGVVIGDTASPTGYSDGSVTLDGLTAYDPLAAVDDTNYLSVSGASGAYYSSCFYVAGGAGSTVGVQPGVLYPTGDTVTMTAGGIVTGGGGGILLVRAWIMAASTPIMAA